MARESGASRLGVIAALAREARVVRIAAEQAGCAGAVTVALSGCGPERAGEAARRLVASGAEALLSTGYAGALVPEIGCGALLTPERVRTEGEREFDVPHAVLAALRDALKGITTAHGGVLVSVDRVVGAAGERRALALGTGAVAVDMESASVARVAAEADLPFAVLRAVSDSATQELPSCILRALDPYGQARPAALVAGLARRPRDVLALLRLARGVRQAERTLRAALAVALPALLAHPWTPPPARAERRITC